MLETNQKISRKDRIANWWKVEGKIECTGAVLLLVILVSFWGNLLVEGTAGLFASIWCLGKIYFRRDKWIVLLLAAVILFQQSVTILFQYKHS